jgi:hypothetical protein
MQYEFYDTQAEADNRVAQHIKQGRCAFAFCFQLQFPGSGFPGSWEVRSWQK